MRSCANGRLSALTSLGDPVFASGAMGAGIALYPSTGELVSPCSGRISFMTPTAHALRIVTEMGIEILLHIGIDTVELDGKFFSPCVVKGQTVSAGEPLIYFDQQAIEKSGYSSVVMILVTHTKHSLHLQLLQELDSEVTAGSDLLAVEEN